MLFSLLIKKVKMLMEPNGAIDDVIAAFYRANSGIDSVTTAPKRNAPRSSKSSVQSARPVQLQSQTGGLLMAVCRLVDCCLVETLKKKTVKRKSVGGNRFQ